MENHQGLGQVAMNGEVQGEVLFRAMREQCNHPAALKAVHTLFQIQMVHLQPMDEEDGIRYHRELKDNKKIDVPERNV
jgi:hypothetical protein